MHILSVNILQEKIIVRELYGKCIHLMITSIWPLQVFFLVLLLYSMFCWRFGVWKSPLKTGLVKSIVEMDTVVWELDIRKLQNHRVSGIGRDFEFLHNWSQSSRRILMRPVQNVLIFKICWPLVNFFNHLRQVCLYLISLNKPVGEQKQLWTGCNCNTQTRGGWGQVEKGKPRITLEISSHWEFEDKFGLESLLLSSSSALRTTSGYFPLIYETPAPYMKQSLWTFASPDIIFLQMKIECREDCMETQQAD